jgi:hypothetical protein
MLYIEGPRDCLRRRDCSEHEGQYYWCGGFGSKGRENDVTASKGACRVVKAVHMQEELQEELKD